MTVYIKSRNQPERVVLDTEKAYLSYEGEHYDLTGAVLSLYDMEWMVGPGTIGAGDDAEPARVLILTDPFTGLRIEIPMPLESAVQTGKALATQPKRGRFARA